MWEGRERRRLHPSPHPGLQPEAGRLVEENRFYVKTYMGLDIRVILLRPVSVTKRGWESFY